MKPFYATPRMSTFITVSYCFFAIEFMLTFAGGPSLSYSLRRYREENRLNANLQT
jgi:hypothetical protein